jgi:hypothetical protein
MDNQLCKRLLYILVFVIVTCLSACQPTPPTEIVVDKNNLEQEILDKTVEETQDVSPRTSEVNNEDIVSWKENYIDEKRIFSVIIDAPIILPDVTSYPVEKVALCQISDEQLSKIVNTLFKDETIYDGNIQLTKGEIAQEIIRVKGETQSSGLKADDNYIKHLEDLYKDAPENVELVPVQPFWKETSKGVKALSLMTQGDGDERAFLYGRTSESEKCYLEYKTNTERYWIIETKKNKPNGISISSQEAEEFALEIMEQFGFDDVQIVSKNIGSLILKDPTNLSEDKQCYIFFLSRTIHGIPFNYASRAGGDFMTDEKPYAPPVNQEIIEVHISDKGVVYFRWESPYEITENLSNNVKLIDLDKIEEIFINQMKMEGQGRNEWYGMNGIIKDLICVERIELGTMVTIDKDNPDEFLCIPVWDFFVTTEQTYSDNRVTTGEGDESNYSIITINAINGSIINRNLGY